MFEENIKRKQKKLLIEKALEEESVVINISTAIKGVILPEYLMVSSIVTLKLSKFFQGHIKLDNTKITSSLKFNGSYFECVIPYDAIFTLINFSGTPTFWDINNPNQEIGSLEKASDNINEVIKKKLDVEELTEVREENLKLKPLKGKATSLKKEPNKDKKKNHLKLVK